MSVARKKEQQWTYEFTPVHDEVTQVQRLGPNSRVEVTANKQGRWWSLSFTTARGSSTDISLPDLGDPQQLHFEKAHRQLADPAIEKCLRALVSLCKRPSDYGVTREQLAELARKKDHSGIIALIPVGRKVGKAKSELTAEDLSTAAALISKSAIGKALLLALTELEPEAKAVSVRLTEHLYRRLAIEGNTRLLSPGQMLQQILRERYGAN